MKRLLILLVLLIVSASVLNAPTAEAFSYCDMVRDSCHGAANQQFVDCTHTGDTPANCLRIMDEFYFNCTAGVGCLPEITELIDDKMRSYDATE